MSLWRTKSINMLEKEAESGKVKLERTLGPVDLIFLGIGAVIGAGLFSITGIAAAENAGPAIVISFILAAIGCTFTGLCFSELASMIPIAGGAYTYTYATIGELFAWIIGWALILEYAAAAVAVSISWSAYVVSLLQDFGIQLPLVLSASSWEKTQLVDGTFAYGLINLPSVIIICLLSYLLITGVSKSAFINSILVVLKVAVVLIFIIVGAFYIKPENYHPFIPANTGEFGEFGWSGVFRAAGVVFFAYIGFDAVSTAAQEVKKPQVDLPIGIIGSLLICTVLYILFSLVLVGLVPYKELNVAAPIAVAINKTPFPWLQSLIKLAIIAGLTSVILVMMLGQSRILYVMAKDGLLPRFFGKIHSKYHTPYICNLVLMVVLSLCAAFLPISLVGHMTSMGTLLAFSMVCLCVLILRKTQPNVPRPFKTPWVPLVPILGIVVSVGLMLSLGLNNWIRLIAWLAIGLVFYFIYGKNNSHLAKKDGV